MIPVTKSFLPPLDDYMAQVQRAYINGWLTNRGALVLELEEQLAPYLELERSKILLMANGTLPLQISLKALAKAGEVITTPFSYVATTAAISWEGCKPVFVDIHPEYLTIDETKIEAAITDKTTCILATHVFGNPCHLEEIDRIARKYNLKVIYDGAHAFGVKYNGRSIFEFGDVSTCSFHATKIFHTGEGGAVFCKDPELFKELYSRHNFGHDGYLAFHGLGINGKMSELQAAMGLSVLSHMNDILASREGSCQEYRKALNHPSLTFPKLRSETHWNYGYFPVLFSSETTLLAVENALNQKKIFPRRYFYPSLSTLDYVPKAEVPVAEDVASRILCLPLFVGITASEIQSIADIIQKILTSDQ